MRRNRPRVLVVFHSVDGQTERIAERIASRLTATGATTRVFPAKRAPEPTGFDMVVLGDSIHLGRHSGSLLHYASQHGAALDKTSTALFQVSLTSAMRDHEHRHLAEQYVATFLDEVSLAPQVVGMFPGRLAYTRVNWLKRWSLRAMAWRAGLPTDTSSDHEFTDWDDVDSFAAEVFDLATTAV